MNAQPSSPTPDAVPAPQENVWLAAVRADPEHPRRYAQRWDRFEEMGRDLDGEARLVDALAERGARILDAGCGTGRVGGRLAALGHTVAERRPALERLRAHLAPGGRMVTGFGAGRGYPFEDFAADAEATGWRVDARFSTWQLHPPAEDFLVALLSRADG